MSVSVVGCGRSGTNLVLEILRGNSFFCASEPPENKDLCDGIMEGKEWIWDNGILKETDIHKNGTYEECYLTKCDTWYFKPHELENVLDRNKHMKIIWTIRDPRDMILSKIRRGQPKSQGGDGSEVVSDDATPDGCIEDINHMYNCYEYIITKCADRVFLIRMEDVINNIEKETKRMCEFIGIPYEKEMCEFTDRMRHPDKRKRYSVLDRSQLSLWKNWKEIYSGFFTENEYPIEDMFNLDLINNLKRKFNYE